MSRTFFVFLNGISWDIRFEFTVPRSLDLYAYRQGFAIYECPFFNLGLLKSHLEKKLCIMMKLSSNYFVHDVYTGGEHDI